MNRTYARVHGFFKRNTSNQISFNVDFTLEHAKACTREAGSSSREPTKLTGRPEFPYVARFDSRRLSSRHGVVAKHGLGPVYRMNERVRKRRCRSPNGIPYGCFRDVFRPRLLRHPHDAYFVPRTIAVRHY